MGEKVHTITKTAEALVVARKEIGLEVNNFKSKHMVMSRNKDAKSSHSIKTDNSSYERKEEFKYVNNLIKSKFNSGRN
jgi:hypothetical protein